MPLWLFRMPFSLLGMSVKLSKGPAYEAQLIYKDWGFDPGEVLDNLADAAAGR